MRPTSHEYHLRGCLTLFAAGTLLSGALLLFVAWSTRADWTNAVEPAGYIGSPRRGRTLIDAYGCTSCHALGSTAPRGAVGPPLDQMASRSYIAGRFANDEIWMTQWIEHPQELKPGTAMPDLGVSRRDALDIAAYLATMK
jgi:cytochrome c